MLLNHIANIQGPLRFLNARFQQNFMNQDKLPQKIITPGNISVSSVDSTKNKIVVENQSPRTQVEGYTADVNLSSFAYSSRTKDEQENMPTFGRISIVKKKDGLSNFSSVKLWSSLKSIKRAKLK